MSPVHNEYEEPIAEAPVAEEAPTAEDNIDSSATTIRGAGNEDQPASLAADTLGFKPYVEAVYSYLANPLTKAPFTLSIEGDWGAGKSSFMFQVEETLKANKHKTVRFNAWRHDKVESMWAAFALHFIKELMHSLSFFPRIIANIRLRWKRFDLGKGWFPLLKTLVLFAFYIFLIIKLYHYIQDESITALIKADKLNWELLATALGGAGFVLASLFFLGKVAEVTGNPFKNDLAKFVTSPNYAGNVAFIEEFHRDFDRTVNLLTNNKGKIFVFIDDLDRADVPKAAELMQGLNMMISNSPRLIFIIGMDREKVAAGVAAKYKDLLPFLNIHQEPLTTTTGMEQARSFGYQFLEKFIQLSFQLPKPSDKFTASFIESLSGVVDTQPKKGPPIRYNPVLTIADGEDTRQFREVTLLLAPFFDHNPRRIKQFVNAFRLKAHIANSTGLFYEIAGDGPDTLHAISIPQLGKFIAATMLWPALTDALINDPELIHKILNGEPIEEWDENEALINLLNLEPDGGYQTVYEMAFVNLKPLLETSPVFNADKTATRDESIGEPSPQSPSNPTTGTTGTTTTTTTTKNPNSYERQSRAKK